MADVQPITSWSSTSANNKPAGTDVIGAGLDDNLREIQGQIATWRDGQGYGELNLTGVSGTNSIAGTTSPAPALAANQKYWFIPQATNTGPAFINVNAAGYKSVFSGGATCVGGEIQISVPASVSYDGTNFHLRGKGPFIDSAPLIQGSSDATKKLKFEVDGFTTATTRTITPPDQDLTISALTAKGDLWVGSSTGVATTKAVGTDGQVLAANSSAVGGVGWTSTSGLGAYVLLATATASVSATVDFTSVISSTYDDYEILFDGILPATNTANLLFRASTNNGSTFLAASQYFASRLNNTASAATPGGLADSAASNITITSNLSNGAGNGAWGRILLHAVSTLNTTSIQWSVTSVDASSNVVFETGGGLVSAGAAVNAIRFLMSAGNIASGTFRLYGIKKS